MTHLALNHNFFTLHFREVSAGVCADSNMKFPAAIDTLTRPLEKEAADASLLHLEAVNLDCVRGDRLLFSRLNLFLRPGNLIHVEGPNGCGKTSLLRILCGLALPNQGEVRWCGQNIRKVRPEFLTDTAYLGHAHGVKVDLTPVENLKVARGLARANPETSIDEALERVGLIGFDDVPAGTLSAGQRRRVALARLLVIRARLWILDEPFTALDSSGVLLVEDILSKQLSGGGMIVLTGHHPVSVTQGHTARLNLTAS